MINYFVLIIYTTILLLSCTGKKNKSANDVGEMQTLLEAYPALTPPLTIGDTSFFKPKNEADSINRNLLSRYIPDSFLTTLSDKKRLRFYPVGKYSDDNAYFLLTSGVSAQRNVLFICAFDKFNQYIAALPVITTKAGTQTDIVLTIDERLNINKVVTQRLSNGIEITGNDVYVYNQPLNKFILVMTDSLGDGFSELTNPIDTLPKKQAYSSDYGKGKMNLISIRDGRRDGRLNFFIHLEKANKTCVGELKGEAIFVAPGIAEYRQAGDPCILKFIFHSKSVTLEEVEGCGSRLGDIECTFNGTYPLKNSH